MLFQEINLEVTVVGNTFENVRFNCLEIVFYQSAPVAQLPAFPLGGCVGLVCCANTEGNWNVRKKMVGCVFL